MITTWNATSVGTYGEYDNSELEILHPELLALVQPTPGKRIIDYGCGEGKLLAELAQQGANVEGFDISEAMVKEARKRIGTNGTATRITSGKIPLPDASVAAAVSNLVLMMVPTTKELETIFEELQRILNPQGTLTYCITHPAFIDKKFTTYRNIFKEKRNYNQEGQPYQFVLRKKDGTEITDESFIDYHHTLETYLNILTKTGFRLREIKEVQIPENEFPPYLIIHAQKNNSKEETL